ncbi:MAG TPA: SprB repeat-containing protein [Niastella sp.]
MTKLLKVFLAIICTFIINRADAQSCKIELKVIRLYSDYHDGDSYGSRFRFYKNSWDDNRNLITWNCDYGPCGTKCIKKEEAFGPSDENIFLNPFTISSASTAFNVGMVTHNERAVGDDCAGGGGGRHPDRHETDSWMNVDLRNYAPGKYVPLGRLDNYHDYSHTYADLMIRYSIPTPDYPEPQPDRNLTTFCANNVLELKTDVHPNNTDLRYEWQFALESEGTQVLNPDKSFQYYYDENDNCGRWLEGDFWPPVWEPGFDCHLPDYVTVQNWRTLTPTNSNTDRFARFTPQQTLFNNNITERQNVYFRVRAYSTEGLYSEWSTPSVFTFLPPPPTLTKSKFIIKPSCPASPNNGQIIIPYDAISTPFQQVRWLLKIGTDTSPCTITVNPDGSINSTCGNIEKQSDGFVRVPTSTDPAPIEINDLPKGDYTLWVVNPGENNGMCFTPLIINIGELPPLALAPLSSSNVSCFAANDGALKLQASGGDPSSGYQFKITASNHPELNTEYTTISGDVFERTGLPADKYIIYMQNACAPPKNVEVVLTEPVKTQGSAIFNQPTCYDPANGSVAVTVSQGMGNYIYQLWKDETKITETPAGTDVNHFFENLLPGRYQVKVLDADRLTCAGWDTTVTLLAPPVLTATILQTDSVSCYGGNDGAIHVQGNGGSGRYVFTLKNNGTTVSSNTDGLFTGLAAGNYQLTTSKPVDENCNDIYERSVAVPQRSELMATMTAQPVTCNGFNNGSVSVVASGGSGSYSYYWEYWDGSNWQHENFWFPDDTQISSLEPGTYRVQVLDNRSTLNCKMISRAVIVTEPAQLQITDVQTTDAACKADGGRIKITAAGGNGNYLYYYSIGDKLHYTAFTENTPLTINGDYYVKVEDAKGCTIEDNRAYYISLPPIPMDFTMQASDYEGVSVSCYNGSNGSITVTASGGSESGYQYALGTGAYQTSPVFDQLAAGNYIVTVKDRRGCSLSKSIQLTQPTQPLQGTIINKQEVGCPGTATGSFGIDIQNGRAPYQYSIDNGNTFQTANTFTGLYTGTYGVVVKDKYDCRWTTNVRLVSMIPPVLFANAVTNVSCFSGNNGAIKVTATGGQPPYQYKWESFANTTDQLAGINAGKYMLHVTDGAGCFSHDTVFVAQPAAALSAVTTTQPVCVGSNGSITVQASGGTPPYKYSANNGNSFQDNAVLNNLPAGTYNVVIKDLNNCQAAYSVVINPANAMPEVNFLVASGKNALDTLVIKEVSMPIPDSVHWSFDPAAQVIENGASPRIKFSSPGNYWVTMTGYFKGCAYTLRKTVYINTYDPDAGLVYTPPVQVIDTVILYPNPNTGQFSVRVKLTRKQKLIMLVQDMGTGREIVRRAYDPVLITDDQFVLGNTSNGTYVLRVIAENDSRDVLFVIKR